MDKRHLVHLPREMREKVADPSAAPAVLAPGEGRFHQRTDRVLKEPGLVVEALQRLAVAPGQFRFVVERVDLAGTAIGEDPDDGFGAGGNMSRFGRERVEG